MAAAVVMLLLHAVAAVAVVVVVAALPLFSVDFLGRGRAPAASRA